MQSTSHSRVVQSGTAVLFEGAGDGDDGNSDSDSEEDGEDGDDDDNDDREELARHIADATAHASAARNAFLAETKSFFWDSSSSTRYDIRAKSWSEDGGGYDGLDEKGFKWPRAYVGRESQPVQAAVWTGSGTLVGLFTFSPGGEIDIHLDI